MTTGDIQAANDEAWGRGPGTPSTLEYTADLRNLIAAISDELGRPDWYFGQSAQAMRTTLTERRAGHIETLRELEARLALAAE
jgi:hypothetical protein